MTTTPFHAATYKTTTRAQWQAATEAWDRWEPTLGALHQMLSGSDEAGREAAWAEIEVRLREFETADGFVGPCEMLVLGGSKPGGDA